MAPNEHESYAGELKELLSQDHPQVEDVPSSHATNERNAAKAMEAIICQRLFERSGHQARKRNATRTETTYEWKEGIFNSRNIADRPYSWTNLRRSVANRLHESAKGRPVAYLLAYSDPADTTTLGVWVIPEPILYDSLAGLSLKRDGAGYAIAIYPGEQRIRAHAASPNMTPYFQELSLSPRELQVLRESRELDARAKGQDSEAGIGERLAALAGQLDEDGDFEPPSVPDARDRILTAIAKRMGQPAFRKGLLAAYKGRCAISGCCVESVLEAAHIVPYRGPKWNHRRNGLLLRADLHTLFDLKLLAVDVDAMRVLVSPSLAGTCYEQYREVPITIPDDPDRRPSPKALKQHRRGSGL
jgi:hypothetical protein